MIYEQLKFIRDNIENISFFNNESSVELINVIVDVHEGKYSVDYIEDYYNSHNALFFDMKENKDIQVLNFTLSYLFKFLITGNEKNMGFITHKLRELSTKCSNQLDV